MPGVHVVDLLVEGLGLTLLRWSIEIASAAALIKSGTIRSVFDLESRGGDGYQLSRKKVIWGGGLCLRLWRRRRGAYPRTKPISLSPPVTVDVHSKKGTSKLPGLRGR